MTMLDAGRVDTENAEAETGQIGSSNVKTFNRGLLELDAVSSR